MVHFPIVLVPLALLADAGWALTQRGSLGRVAAAAWVVAAASAGAAYAAGESAADGLVNTPAAAHAAIGEHADWAASTVTAVAVVAILRALVELGPAKTPPRLFRAVASLLGVASVVSLLMTADLGGTLVYQHALAVEPPQCPEGHSIKEARRSTPGGSIHTTLLREEQGTHVWTPTSQDAGVLGAATWPSRGAAYSVSGLLDIDFQPVLGGVQVNAWLDLHAFDGEVRLRHHQADGQGGALVLATSGSMRLENRAPQTTTLASSEVEISDRVAVAVHASGSHLKGLLDGKTVVHGHAPSQNEGTVALSFVGHGIVGIERVEVVPLGGR